MPLYQYQAFDAEGAKRSGQLESSSLREAKERLRRQGLMVATIAVVEAGGTKHDLKGKTLAEFTLQLAQLVNAGIPLYESLIAIEQVSRSESYHPVLLSLCDQIQRGRSLSEAMQGFPKSFSGLYLAMITAGEASGALGLVLEKLHFFLERQQKLRQEITTAMIYPTILAVFCLGVVALMLGFVVPSISGIFEGRELGTFTKFVMGCSTFFRNYWWLLLTFGSVGAFFLYSRGKRLLFRIPKLRDIMVRAAFTRFVRTMATLHESGLPLLDSLRISRGVMQNEVLEEEVRRVEEKIITGSSLSHELAQSSYFPKVAIRMLAIGEDSGSLGEMLEKVATIYEQEMEKTLTRMLALVQPVILLVMGLIIGLVMIGILMPLSDLSSFSTME